MAVEHEVKRSAASKALAKVAGWRDSLRERFGALSFCRLAGKGPTTRRRPPRSRLRRPR